jgi:hypothetical protein
MEGDAGIYNGRSATESAHIDIISERLRLLYVGITRAKRPGLSRCDPGTLFWTVFTTFAERKFSLAIRETAALFAGR